MLARKKRNVTFLIVVCIFVIGFLKINFEITKTLGENNTSPIKTYYNQNPLALKIDFKKYKIQLSKDIMLQFKENLQNIIK
ncbi:hypothetical protein HAHI6034_02525 [Hathewaya histolytica]|uniref:Uncharacterized protein n=1 Tax=Hathewaya histolytica TaxID=1498 RepID=A0A4U9RFS7_HATHI|nr:hypothetical protein [Hathewaya histolytica]VTQ90715.1 Uncharacterised protein [Hathewaya histolytica]